MSDIEEIVKDAYALKELEWKPLYPNNMPCNHLEGYYALKLHELEEGVVSGRKYTILFQRKIDEEGMIISEEVEYYVLLEKSYCEIVGALQHPEPSNASIDSETERSNTLHSLEVNDYGRFSCVCKTLEAAKKMAIKNYQGVFGYALSYLL